MTWRVVVSQQVYTQIDEQIVYLLRQGVDHQTISRWLGGLSDAFEGLQTHPKRYPLDRDRSFIKQHEIRRMNYADFAIFYRINDLEQSVEILDLRHAARRPWPDEPNQN